MKHAPRKRSTRPGGGSDHPGLSPRLAGLAELVPPGATVVDVGAGHGLLGAALLASGRAAGCIVTERSRQAGRELLRAASRDARLEVRFGDGLRALDDRDRSEVLVLSGLGTRSIQRILEGCPDRARRFRRLVLQPQTEVARLRRWLVQRGWSIADERMARDRGRLYVAVAAEPEARPLPEPPPGLSPDDLLEAGPFLARGGDPLVVEYWDRAYRRLSRILGAAGPGMRHPRVERARDRAERILAALGFPPQG